MMEIPEHLKPMVSLDVHKSVIRVDITQQRRSDIQTLIRQLRERYNRPFSVEGVDLSTLSASASGKKNRPTQEVSFEFIKQAVRDLINEAAEYRASDVHIVIGEAHTSVQFEVDGALRQLPTLAREKGELMIRAAYQSLATISDSSYMLSSFQNASIPGTEFKPALKVSGVRIQRGPCFPYDKGCEFMTLRVQYHDGGHRGRMRMCEYPFPKAPDVGPDFAAMGFDERQEQLLTELMSSPNGIVFVTGPVGSGKSTTIFNMLAAKMHDRPYLRLVTVEDPIEVPIPGAVQLAVQNAHTEQERSRAFQQAMNAMLRMAPRWMYFGEIRDEVVAQVALESAISGHEIYTTLHLSDPFQWAERLAGLNRSGLLNKKNYCDAKQVRGVIGQRLLSLLCPACASALPEDPTRRQRARGLLEDLRTWGDCERVQFRGSGCRECGYSGVSGRVVVAEIILTNPKMMADLLTGGPEVARRRYAELPEADLPLIQRGIRWALSGRIDPFEVIERIDLIQPQSVLRG